MRRRALMISGASMLPGAATASAQRPVEVEAWRDPNCGCCSEWVARLREAGFTVRDRVVASVGPYRQVLGTPLDLMSCHAGRVAGYALEGHVPPQALRRLLRERPTELRGLAVPGMPMGSPGMEVEGHEPETFDVVAFKADGTSSPWMRFRGGEPV